MQRAKLLFGSYRRNDAADPETYVLAVSAVLARYEEETIREVTDPTTGICTVDKFRAFLPNAGELKAFCDSRAGYRARLKQYADLPKPDFSRKALPAPEPRPGRRANLIVPREDARYPEMCERAKRPDADPAEFEWHAKGIKVAWSWWQREREPSGWKSATVLTASPQLAAMLNPQREEAAE